ncbi:DUF4345 domain-containing protein [bacterium]|nr:DUF4345 domain-containing protein [bacterium]
MHGRWFLALSALVWFPYGLFCFFNPVALAGGAGVVFTTATGASELRAMYGGLQAALGLLAFAGMQRETLRRPALVTLFTVTAGLGIARLLGAVSDGAWSGYTLMGLVFEWGSMLWSGALLRRL